MIKRIHKLLENYRQLLSESFSITNAGEGWYMIETPFVDPDGDFIDVYVKIEEDEVIISDDVGILRNYIDEKELASILFLENINVDEDSTIYMKTPINEFPANFTKFLQVVIFIRYRTHQKIMES